ncbi:hypothetical protein OQA88_9395 [Cercophora sp. LCS_1]
MRLLNTRSLQIKEFHGSSFPPYTILSHTWGAEEVSFQEMMDLMNRPSAQSGFGKIRNASKVALEENYEWIWIDTCCIDKSSSAELTEAINSMYNRYKRAEVCFVYLEDLSENHPLGSCRWFTRGWTLQELIAPRHMIFLDRRWKRRGTKANLVNEIAERTGIDKGILLHDKPLSTMSVAQKMSWASNRRTTRVEDTAYCLLGVFGVQLSLRYGEERQAFRRLQEAIISSVPDLSVFAWRRSRPLTTEEAESACQRQHCGVLAVDPQDFADSGSLVKKKPFARHELLSLNGAIMAKLQLLIEARQEAGYRYLLPLDCSYESRQGVRLCVRLRKCGYNEFPA